MDSSLASERIKIETLSAVAAEAVSSRDALLAEKTLLQKQLDEMEARFVSERLEVESIVHRTETLASAADLRVVELEEALSCAREEAIHYLEASEERASALAALQHELSGMTSGYEHERAEAANHRLVALKLQDDLTTARAESAKQQGDLITARAESTRLREEALGLHSELCTARQGMVALQAELSGVLATSGSYN